MRICYLITDLISGGSQWSLARLARRVAGAGHDVRVVCLNRPETVAGVLRSWGLGVVSLEMNRKSDVLAPLRLYRLLREYRPDVLHAYLFHANMLAKVAGRAAGVPAVITSERTMLMESPARVYANRLTAPLADAVVVVADAVRDYAVQSIGLPPGKITRIYNGLETDRYENLPPTDEARRALGIPESARVVGSVIRLDFAKGGDVLIRAFGQVAGSHPDSALLLAGDGAERAALEGLARSVGIAGRAHFAGDVPDTRPYLAAMDVFVLPSRFEGLPNAPIEAMAAGLPVVATEVGGTPEVVLDGETGLLVPPEDEDALAGAICRLLDDPALSTRMSGAGRARARSLFDIEKTSRETLRLYEALLHGRGHRARTTVS